MPGQEQNLLARFLRGLLLLSHIFPKGNVHLAALHSLVINLVSGKAILVTQNDVGSKQLQGPSCTWLRRMR